MVQHVSEMVDHLKASSQWQVGGGELIRGVKKADTNHVDEQMVNSWIVQYSICTKSPIKNL